MTKPNTFLSLAFVAAALSCDDGASRGGVSPPAGLESTDGCAIGMFRPVGLSGCVFSAQDQSGLMVAYDDNRCASGQPAFPPTCVSDTGRRPYLTTTTTCAPNYHYQAAVCERIDQGGSTGFAGFTGQEGGFTGFAGDTGEPGGSTGEGGFPGTAGSTADFGTGGTSAAGNSGTAGDTGTGGVTGSGGGTSTAGTTGASGTTV